MRPLAKIGIYWAVHPSAAHIGGSRYLFDGPHEKLPILKTVTEN